MIQRPLGDPAEQQAPEATDTAGADDEDAGSGAGNDSEQLVEGRAERTLVRPLQPARPRRAGSRTNRYRAVGGAPYPRYDLFSRDAPEAPPEAALCQAATIPSVLGKEPAGANSEEGRGHVVGVAAEGSVAPAGIDGIGTRRANTAALLRRLPDSAWSKVGRHTESGRYTAEDWLQIYADHLENHARQIEANVAAWNGAR